MGQIQNSFNQLFASGIGASLAISHSPYAKYKAAHEEARVRADEAFATYQAIQEVPPGDIEYGDIQELPGREDLQTKRDLLEYAGQLETAEKEWLEAENAVREVDISLGPRSKKLQAIQDRGVERHEQLIDLKKTPEEMALQRLQQAYKYRQTLGEAVPARKDLVEKQGKKVSYWSREGAELQTKKTLKKAERQAMKDPEFRKPEQLL